MPQVQVLPAVPTFGSRLADTIRQAGGQFAEAFQKRQDHQRAAQAFATLQNPNLTPLQRVNAFMQLPEEYKKHASPIWAAILGPQAQAEADLNEYNRMQGGQAQGANEFASQFVPGTMPQQEGDSRNIKPSVTPPPTSGLPPSVLTPAQTRDRQGLPLGSQQAAVPGVSGAGGMGSGTDASEEELSALRQKAKFKGSKNRFLAADAEEASRRLDQLEQIAKEQRGEAQEMRKLNRAEINKYSEPYENIASLKQNVGKLKKAQKLIQDEKVSFDENKFRNLLVAALEDKESTVADVLKTDAQQELFYLLRDALKPKEIGGSNPSTREVLIAMASLPSMFKGKQANLAIIGDMLSNAEENLHRGEFITDLKKEDKNLSLNPGQFKERVEKSASKFKNQRAVKGQQLPAGSVWMMSPDGQIGSVPKDRIKEAEEQGYNLLEQ